jgi:mono/diheme cytochrome c family protein
MSRHDMSWPSRWKRGLTLPVLFWGLCLVVAGSAGTVQAQAVKESAPKVSETVMNGWRWFHVYCFRCHGVDALGSQIAPNLRQSIKSLSHEDFTKVVREGKPKTAMQAWKQLLDDAQIEDIYQYVLARSEERLGRGRPDE